MQVNLICPQCNCHFRVYKSDYLRRANKIIFCSRKCFSESKWISEPCWICGDEIKIRLSRHKKRKSFLCSKECNDAYVKKTLYKNKKCEHCGKFYEVLKSIDRRLDKKFCSHKCLSLSRVRNIIQQCIICGERFQVNASTYKSKKRGLVCSNKCKYKLNAIKRRKPKVSNICFNCNKQFVTPLGDEQIYCSEDCYNTYRSENKTSPPQRPTKEKTDLFI